MRDSPPVRYSPRSWRFPSPGLSFAAKLLFNEGNDTFHRGKVVSCHFFILYGDGEALLNKHHEFDHPLRVNHIAQQRQIIIECFVPAKQKSLSKKAANFLSYLCRFD